MMYPLLNLAYVVTVVLAATYPREPVHALRWVGIILIIIGSILVGINWLRKIFKRSPFPNIEPRWCSPVKHAGLSSPRPGFKSRPGHHNSNKLRLREV